MKPRYITAPSALVYFILLLTTLTCRTPDEDLITGRSVAATSDSRPFQPQDPEKNPLLLRNMRAFQKDLLEQEVKGNPNMRLSSVLTRPVEATHYYVQFSPLTEEAVQDLKRDSSLSLYPFPMHLDFPPGTMYEDPTLPEGQPIRQYAVVPVSYKFNLSTNHKVLEELHIPQLDSPFMSALGSKEIRPSNGPPSASNARMARRASSGTSPHTTVEGSVKVNVNGTLLPLPGVEVRLRLYKYITVTRYVCYTYEDNMAVVPSPSDAGLEPSSGSSGNQNHVECETFTTPEIRDVVGRSIRTNQQGEYSVRLPSSYGTGISRSLIFKSPNQFVVKRSRYLNYPSTDHTATYYGGRGTVSTENEITKDKKDILDILICGADQVSLAITYLAAHTYYNGDILGMILRPPNGGEAGYPYLREYKIRITSDRSFPVAGAFCKKSDTENGCKYNNPSIIVSAASMRGKPECAYALVMHELAHATHSTRIGFHYDTEDRKKVVETWAKTVEVLLTRKVFKTFRGTCLKLSSRYTGFGIDLVDPLGPNTVGEIDLAPEVSNGVDVVELPSPGLRKCECALQLGSGSFSGWKDSLISLYFRNDPTEKARINRLFNYWNTYRGAAYRLASARSTGRSRGCMTD